MLAANGLLAALAKEESKEVYKDHNDDYDFGKVLQRYSPDGVKNKGHVLRYSDGTEKAFSFDD